MKLLLIGHGRMGRLVETLAPEYGAEVVGVVTTGSGARALADATHGGVDVAIDFSNAAAVRSTIERLAARRINVVIGTTGWKADEAECRAIAERAGIGVLAAANFSIGMAIFRALAIEAAKRFAVRGDVGAWLHELHHSAKKDAPSGTALMLQQAMQQAGYDRPISMASSRAGSIPGTHEIGFDGPAETVALTHTVRDRAVFAHGALAAAQWLVGRTGWFGIDDFIGSRL